MAKVIFQTAFKRKLGLGEIVIQHKARSLLELLDACDTHTGKPVKELLLKSDGSLIHGVIILINGKNVLLLQGLETLVQPDDEVILFPAAGGG